VGGIPGLVDVVAAVGFALGLIWLVMLGQGLNRACRPKIANKLSSMIESARELSAQIHKCRLRRKKTESDGLAERPRQFLRDISSDT
jgi:hypothetical protein